MPSVLWVYWRLHRFRYGRRKFDVCVAVRKITICGGEKPLDEVYFNAKSAEFASP